MRSVGSAKRAGGVPQAVNDVLAGRSGRWRAGHRTRPQRFGSVRFRAEVAGSQSAVPWFNDHSHYYDMGSEALHIC